MTDIILSTQNGEPVASSRQIAESFGKEHKDVLRAIENIKAQNCALTSMFFEATYTAGTGKAYPMYLMNRDGFTLLAMGFTGKAALEWKLKYIAAFNEMEKKLNAPQMPKLSKEMQALFLLDDRTQKQEQRLTALENTMTVDYNQQRGHVRRSQQRGNVRLLQHRGNVRQSQQCGNVRQLQHGHSNRRLLQCTSRRQKQPCNCKRRS